MRILLFTLTLVLGLHGAAQQDSLPHTYRSLQEALEHPSKVLRLDLSDKRLEEFPPEILLMTNLEELRLRNDGIRSLPPGIGGLSKLRTLDLSGNPITVLPDEFTQLRSLEVLLLNDDPALDLEHDLELLSRLPRLRILELRGDGIRQLPSSIGRMEHLEELYLNNNQLQAFPAELNGMRALKLIDLGTNPVQPLIPLDLQQRGVLVRF
jgi:Leucine-rich repeat (LRR) protein